VVQAKTTEQCEEAYVMGSSYDALHPLYPLAKTLGVVNMDILNVRCVTKDVIITGFGQSDLDDYHHPSDVVRPDWDVPGLAQDATFFWMLGYRVAQAAAYPQWKTGSEFRATREAQLGAAVR
jgi:Zn-dependent M28 family amino/carboxypeptidase